MEIITRKESRRRGLTFYVTGKVCKNGHIAERYVSCKTCVECERASTRARYAANPEKVAAQSRAWRVANREKVRASNRAWKAANPEKQAASERAWRAANPEKKAAKSRAWGAANPDRWAAEHGLANARQRFPGSAPKKFDPATIPFYTEARRRTRETGVLHVVDHVIALCLGGLHVASNLQVITEAANREKANAEKAEAKRRKQQGKTV